MKRIIIILSLIVLSSVSCGGEQIKQEKTEYIKAEEITDKHIKIIKEKYFESPNAIVYFSNIIYEYNDSSFVFPVFGGTMGNIKYQEIRKYAINKKLLNDKYGMGIYIFQCKKGEVKKQLHEMLKFYQEKFSEYETDCIDFQDLDSKRKVDLKKPCEFFLENNYASFCYSLFDKNGCRWSFAINVDVAKNSPETSNPYEIIPNENNPKRIYFSFH